ncbi:MAG: carbohydrate porin [Candidatus Omnitrophota bacterium]
MKNTILRPVMIAAVLFCMSAQAFAQVSDDDVAMLKRELAAMKERVSVLERAEAERKSAAVSAVKEACPEIAKTVASDVKKDMGPATEAISEEGTLSVLRTVSTESALGSRDVLIKQPDYLPNYITKGLEYHGYFRSGYGVNSKGGKMQAFQAPDALAKYRLGNEQETYIESIFLNRNWNPDPEGVTLETQIRVAYQTQQNQTWDINNEVVLREMFGRMGHFLNWDPGAKVWAGQRFCRLPELDINDFWWYDMSGYGGGFEDINCGIGKLDVTLIGFASNDINLSTHRGRLSKENINFKLGDVDVPYGKGMFWVNGGYMKGGVDTANTGLKYPDMGGVDIGFMHYMPGELNNNQFAAQFGCGSNTSLSAGANLPSGGDDRNSWRVRFTDMFNRQFTKNLSAQAVGVYQYTDSGDSTKNSETWASFGLRPIYMFTKHFGIEVEPGMDYINNPADNFDTCLFKLTGGIRISPGMIFNSRPAFRLFATYARWGNGFKGNPLLGGDAFLPQSEGMNYGIQCENWW